MKKTANYSESKKILAEVKKAKRILVNCHRGPDPDSIGSALALFEVLRKWDKKVTLVCSSNELFDKINFLHNYSKIQKGVNFSNIDYSKHDLFITLDSSSWGMVTGDNNIPIPKIPMVVIDHHKTNPKYGTVNLVDSNVQSVGELMYRVFMDWGIKLNKHIATDLLTGMIGDTGAFRYPGSTDETFRAVGELVANGADTDMIIHHIYRSEPFQLVKFYGEVLNRLKLDRRGRFVWATVPFEVYKSLGMPSSAKEASASLFAQVVDNTDFGFIAVEVEKDKLAVSFRSRTGFDTSKIAVELGGGGHSAASGAKIVGMPFEKAVNKLLKVARKHAKRGKK